jgi:predicted ATPase
LTAYRATGGEAHLPKTLSLLAEAYGKVGQAEEGLMVLAEALAMVNKNGERFYEAELYRLKGELTLQKFQVSGSKFHVTTPQHPTPNPQVEAEEYFLKAIDIARCQQAKSLELRAVMSLVRLRLPQATHEGSRPTDHASWIKFNEAHHLLSEIYGWFTEGFDTKDLQEAKALLDEVARDA